MLRTYSLGQKDKVRQWPVAQHLVALVFTRADLGYLLTSFHRDFCCVGANSNKEIWTNRAIIICRICLVLCLNVPHYTRLVRREGVLAESVLIREAASAELMHRCFLCCVLALMNVFLPGGFLNSGPDLS